MTKNFKVILLGYDYDTWYGYGERLPIFKNISFGRNNHMLIAGMSGSGKTTFTNTLMARLYKAENQNCKIFIGDFKGDDNFAHLVGTKNYFFYDEMIEAIDMVYTILHERMAGNKDRTPVYLFLDEYMSFVLSVRAREKKKAEIVMTQVAEILAMGRSMACSIIVATQNAYASAFPEGSRQNFACIVICGAPLRSIYEMLLPKEYIEQIGERKFKEGEGVVLLDGVKLCCIKMPLMKDEKKVREICVEALSK